jgi:hypothetical protein
MSAVCCKTLSGEPVALLLQEEWPEVYWKALQRMGRKQAVDVPAPHPKFTVQVRGTPAQQMQWRLVVLCSWAVKASSSATC